MAAVRISDMRGEYVPTPKERRANARRLARDAMRAQSREAWLAQRGTGATVVTLREAMYRDAISTISQLMVEADEDRDRLKAAEIAATHELECQRLMLELNGGRVLQAVSGLNASGTQPAAAPSNLLTREEAIEELKRRRVAQLQGAR
jgi:hypothetical protein